MTMTMTMTMAMIVDNDYGYDDNYDYGRIKNLFNLRNLWLYILKFKPWTSVLSFRFANKIR